MANEYTTLALLKGTLAITSTDYDNDLNASLSAASRGIDGACGRRFWADSNASQVRVFTPESYRRVFIGDLITLTTLKCDQGGDGTFEETWTSGTDFVLEPLNAAVETPVQPYTSVLVRRQSTRCFPTCYEASVQVTGKFGWPAVTAEIVEATSILAGILFKRKREAPFGIVSFGGADSAAAMRIARTDPQVAALIADYIWTTPFI
jgi:hypothetical protein